jgi:hypothetical protein
MEEATPTVEDRKPAPAPEPEVADELEISRGDLASSLAGQEPSKAQLASAARSFGLSLNEITALAKGQADLRLTRAQYEQLRAKIAKQYAQTIGKEADDAKSGSLCGSSGSPSPPAATAVPPVTSTNNKRKITVEGKKEHEGTVDGGTVTLRTNAQEDIDTHPDNFTIGYKGPDAPNQHWLQFINREVVGVHADGSAHPVNDSITTSGTRGGSYKLTLGGTATSKGAPKEENYNTDSDDSSDPFYEKGNASGEPANRTADSTTIIDMPSSAKAKVDAAFAAGAKKVVSRANFTTFLVHTDKVVYKVQVTVEWTFASAATTDPRPSMSSEGGGKATELPSTIRTKFHSQYPAFNFIK